MDKEKTTGIVISLPQSVWLEVEQRVLDLKKIGVKTNTATEAAKLIQLGLKVEIK